MQKTKFKNQMENLIENLTRAYLSLYQSVKTRKTQELIEEIKNGNTYEKYKRI
jgi:hypothetical protein